MNEPELKYCPFCGKKAVLLVVYSASGGRYWAVKCESCKAQTHYEDTKPKAVKNWNQRVC